MALRRTDGERVVYSSDQGRMCPDCGAAVARCRCRKGAGRAAQPSADGVIRIHRETKGRGGKVVSIIRGLPLSETALKTLAKELKRRCGTGGAVKEDTIEIQGEHRDLLVSELQSRGYTVKKAGG